MSDQSIPQTSEACCEIAPVQNNNYKPKGEKVALCSYQEVYVVGPEDSKTAVICEYNYWMVRLFTNYRGSSMPHWSIPGVPAIIQSDLVHCSVTALFLASDY